MKGFSGFLELLSTMSYVDVGESPKTIATTTTVETPPAGCPPLINTYIHNIHNNTSLAFVALQHPPRSLKLQKSLQNFFKKTKKAPKCLKSLKRSNYV